MSRFYVPGKGFAESVVEYVRLNPGVNRIIAGTRVAYHWKRGHNYPYTVIDRLVAAGTLRVGRRERITYSCPGDIPTVTGYDEVLFVAESEAAA